MILVYIELLAGVDLERFMAAEKLTQEKCKDFVTYIESDILSVLAKIRSFICFWFNPNHQVCFDILGLEGWGNLPPPPSN